jgi:hypothetical protein
MKYSNISMAWFRDGPATELHLGAAFLPGGKICRDPSCLFPGARLPRADGAYIKEKLPFRPGSTSEPTATGSFRQMAS